MALVPTEKNPGVHYARTDDGAELPVIDVTHPAFMPPFDEAQMARRLALFVWGERARARIPQRLQRAVLRFAALRSRLARALYHAPDGVVNGMALYAAKLGPDMLGAARWSIIDRLAATAPPAWLTRVRLLDMARLLADGIAPLLATRAGAPLHLLNIAGGPAADSWNALLLLEKERPGGLGGRPITIHVLDPDEEGPAFGARAVAAMQSDGAPLHHLDLSFRHRPYDWRDTTTIATLLGEIDAKHAAVAVSSEGGLFEYASDKEIVQNLDAIRASTAPDCIVVGSVTRAEGPIEFLRQFTVRPRTLRAFGDLAGRAGWSIATVLERPLSYDVRLTRVA